MSRDCYVALPHDVTGLSAVFIMVYPDHTHLLFWIILLNFKEREREREREGEREREREREREKERERELVTLLM